MTDIQRRLRDLGERVREEQGPSALPADTRRAAKRRRLGTVATSLAVVAALAFGGTFAAGAFDTTPSTLPPAGPINQPDTIRLQAAFPGRGRASAIVDLEEGTVCFGMADLRAGRGSYTSIQILLGQDATRPVVLTPPPGGQEDRPCVGNLDSSLLEAIVSDPGRYYLEIKVPTNEFTGEETLLASLASPATDDCTRVDFEPTYLPEGWIAELQEGGAGGDDPFGNIVGHYGAEGSASVRRKMHAGFINLVGFEFRFEPPTDGDLVVLGESADLDEENGTIEFGSDGCAYALVGGGVGREDLVPFAEGLRFKERGEDPVPGDDSGTHRVSREHFSAVWPSDTYDLTREACDSTERFLMDPTSAALEFGYQVLGWNGGARFAEGSSSEGENATVELSRSESDPEGTFVLVNLLEFKEGCWVVSGVQRSPEESQRYQEYEGASLSVQGRKVQAYFADFQDGVSATVEVGYGGAVTQHLWQSGDEVVEFQLEFEPEGRGHYLILLRDANGEVVSAFGSGLPEGGFAAG